MAGGLDVLVNGMATEKESDIFAEIAPNDLHITSLQKKYLATAPPGTSLPSKLIRKYLQ